jgi:hypothetical protein
VLERSALSGEALDPGALDRALDGVMRSVMRSPSAGALALENALRSALSVVGIAAPGWVLGCASPVVPPTSATLPRESGFIPLACTPGAYGSHVPSLLGELRPALPVDYVDLDDGGNVSARGKACSGAHDPSACLVQLEASWSASQVARLDRIGDSDWTLACTLRATRGDDVLFIDTTRDLVQFLGAIDTLAEAELWVECNARVVFAQSIPIRGFFLDCARSGGVVREGGFDVLAFNLDGCDGITRHLLRVDPGGGVSRLESVKERDPTPMCVPGRRPEGFPSRALSGGSLGAFFAHSAELEAASVPAFVRLASELEAHGAPRSLMRRALGAARDEVRHAGAVATLAWTWGGRPCLPRWPVGSVRSLERIALENAVEGCVHETYAALVAHHQAARALSSRIAAEYSAIARDEARHAALAWDVARWAEPRLSGRARRRVATARFAAALELQRTLAHSAQRPFDAVAGLPGAARGHELARELHSKLWRNGALV